MEAAEAALRFVAACVGLLVEGIAVLYIALGALETAVLLIGRWAGFFPRKSGWRRETFVRFGRWLLLSLEFALAADIVRTVISPTWNDLGQLAAIAIIRTFLNYFLERDMREADKFAAAGA